MKAFLNLEFDDGSELRAFMERYLGQPQFVQYVVTGASGTRLDAEIVAQAAAAQETNNTDAEQNLTLPQPTRTRRLRSDAGQARGPNKTTTGESAASEPGTGGQASATSLTPAAPVAPTTLTPPASATPPAAPPSAVAAMAPAGAGVKLTEALARAELKKINAEPGMGGTQACIDYLKKFGVLQIAKLPESMYEQFIAGVDKEIAAFRAKPKAPAAK